MKSLSNTAAPSDPAETICELVKELQDLAVTIDSGAAKDKAAAWFRGTKAASDAAAKAVIPAKQMAVAAKEKSQAAAKDAAKAIGAAKEKAAAAKEKSQGWFRQKESLKKDWFRHKKSLQLAVAPESNTTTQVMPSQQAAYCAIEKLLCKLGGASGSPGL